MINSNSKDAVQELREAAKRGSVQTSVRWYKDNIRKLGLNRITPRDAFGTVGTITQIAQAGRMYLYMYDPKTKEKLPFYDTFPLVLPFRMMGDGFYGINLHYIPPILRMNLLVKLMEFATAKHLTEKSKIRMSWQLIGNLARFPEVEPCVKRYLYSHIQSNFLLIHPQDWKTTIMLPLESFQKKSTQAVYRDSTRKING